MKIAAKAVFTVVVGATVAYGTLSVGSAEAASVINFSYEYNNDFKAPDLGQRLLISGTVTGDIVDGNRVANLTNLSALLQDLSGSVGGSPFSLKLINNPITSAIFTLDGTGLDLSFQGMFDPNITAALNFNGPIFAQATLPGGSSFVEDDVFGNWQTSIQPATAVPTPALLPGVIAMGGAMRRRLRRKQEQAA